MGRELHIFLVTRGFHDLYLITLVSVTIEASLGVYLIFKGPLNVSPLGKPVIIFIFKGFVVIQRPFVLTFITTIMMPIYNLSSITILLDILLKSIQTN